ncbi:MAG: hypothetical protein ACW992_05240 [Candidatus Thorarchaeota archaeon]
MSSVTSSAAKVGVSASSDVSADEDGPVMEYYPRKFLTDSYHFHNLSVVVFANDPDGVDSVAMLFSTVDSGEWNRTELKRNDVNIDRFEGNLIFEGNATQSGELVSYSVRYIANDSLGNEVESPTFEFGVYFTVITVDGGAELYDTPDLWYEVNTAGHEVTWATRTGGRTYVLHKDGLLLELHRWEQELTINVDGLPLGEHVYSLYVRTGAWGDFDNVTVHVVEETPEGVPTDSVGPQSGPFDTELGYLPVIVGGVLFVFVILVWIVRRQRIG